VLDAYGFAPDSLQVVGMLDEIHAAGVLESSSAGAADAMVFRLKHAHAASAH
jgi:hypothetical protein